MAENISCSGVFLNELDGGETGCIDTMVGMDAQSVPWSMEDPRALLVLVISLSINLTPSPLLEMETVMKPWLVLDLLHMP